MVVISSVLNTLIGDMLCEAKRVTTLYVAYTSRHTSVVYHVYIIRVHNMLRKYSVCITSMENGCTMYYLQFCVQNGALKNAIYMYMHVHVYTCITLPVRKVHTIS